MSTTTGHRYDVAVIYRFGTFDFNADSGELRKHARRVSLEWQPSRVLAILVARAGELVPREALRESVWGDTHVDFDRGLAYCLSQIRSALGDRSDNPTFIQTFPKRGYKFIAPVTLDAAPVTLDAPAANTRSADLQVSRRWYILAAVSVVLLLLTTWFFINRRNAAILVAVSIFDNETGVAEYDRPIAGLSDLVVVSLANLAPDRLAVIGNADVLRRPRNIRNLRGVAEGVHADYVLLGQLQHGEKGLRFVTHFIRLRDMAHLKANRLYLSGDGLSGLETAVVEEFERAARAHLLTSTAN
ncbi:MAG TPA: winged helix-turn-helix domain-containing protein [Vicinamibacterales bacterium]|nr:winged helix-turn-helix domain-containing protein [Vicinamibacterales bacterium]